MHSTTRINNDKSACRKVRSVQVPARLKSARDLRCPGYSALPDELQHGDVVILAEGFSSLRDRFGGMVRDRCGAHEAKEFAVGTLGLDNAVGDESKQTPRPEVEDGFRIRACGNQPQRKAAIAGQLPSVELGSDVAGIGQRQRAIDIGAQGETGRESAAASVRRSADLQFESASDGRGIR